MLQEGRQDKDYEKLVNKVIERVKKQGYSDIKAVIDDYESPSKLINKNSNVDYLPDVTAQKNGEKGYFEIARKIKDTDKLVNKWKALSTLAEMRDGVFQVFVPHGHMKFTRELLDEHNINAQVFKI
jgi:hypothetical protein